MDEKFCHALASAIERGAERVTLDHARPAPAQDT
jgi:hypothetical protein